MECKCGKPAMYKKECRDCYEDRLRHAAVDAYYNSDSVILDRVQRRNRTSMSFIAMYIRRDYIP